MKAKLQLWIRLAILFIELCLMVGAVAFPLVFSEAVLANFMRVLEVLAHAS